jgi:hypothetical protein
MKNIGQQKRGVRRPAGRIIAVCCLSSGVEAAYSVSSTYRVAAGSTECCRVSHPYLQQKKNTEGELSYPYRTYWRMRCNELITMAVPTTTNSGNSSSSGYNNSHPNTNNIANSTSTKSRSRCTSTNAWILVITIFVAFSTLVNVLHGKYVDTDPTSPRFLHQFVIGRRNKDLTIRNARDNNQHKLAGLSCKIHGGPFDESAVEKEMVYWSDIPSDYTYQSPFHRANNGREKFLTFEPDHGYVWEIKVNFRVYY